MSAGSMQRDLVVNLKREISLNARVLNKLRPMSPELSQLIFKENAVYKVTQNMFNHFSYYLVSIIDIEAANKFLWPLYDSKTEKLYRVRLSEFIADYNNKGLSHIMLSYLVNPGCYKVTLLLFQMSQLAVQRLLVSKLTIKSKKDLYKSMTEKYKSKSEGFIKDVDGEVKAIQTKIYQHQRKRSALVEIAALLRERIVSMEEKLEKAQKFLHNLTDKYIKDTSVDEAIKNEMMIILNVSKPAAFFDSWLEYVDVCVKEMNTKWNENFTPFLDICMSCQKNSADLIARHTGEADCNSYMVEYNHVTDQICTNELENRVNSQQKYILKNIVRNERLYFPNLIRGFLISICYILENNEIGEIYKFNEYLEDQHRNMNELVLAMRFLNNRVMNAEAKLQPLQLSFEQSVSMKEFEIPPLPDLSGLKASRESAGQILFETFTPLGMSKHQFNLHRKYNSFSFSKSQPKVLITPFHQGPPDSFLNSLISCRITTYDHPNVSTNFNNISAISQPNSRGNETIAECSARFTKQQIVRLMSNKKTSSTKKFKQATVRPNANVIKGGLFDESSVSSHNIVKCYLNTGTRNLSVMKEGSPSPCSPSLLEVSGITALEKEDTFCTPEAISGSRKKIEPSSFPAMDVTPATNVERVFKEIEEDLNKEIDEKINDNKIQSKEIFILNKEISNECSELATVELSGSRKSIEIKEELKTETPKTDAQLMRKTSSLEKIINRFKKVRANVMPADGKIEESNFMTIAEEKENAVNIDFLTANRILLPDLLSPSCSVLSIKSTEYLDQLCSDVEDKESRKPRQSLGTVLGVDNTFLDQYDLID